MNKLKYQHSSYTLTEWTEINPIIVKDEIVIEKGINNDADKLKIGNGINNYLSLPYFKIESEKLDFLLVDAWNGLEGNYFYTITKGATLINTTDGMIYQSIANEALDDWNIIAGVESVPYVPISQTTIFVHPTTFERYRFNGTTMEVYEDVDGVVPKWLKYEALLTQSGTDAPVARILNQDEKDFSGVVVWEYVDNGVFTTKKLYNENLTTINHKNVILNNSNNILLSYVDDNVQLDGSQKIYLFSISEGANADSVLFNTFIEIKQRLRGAPPKLLSAETNTTGDKVILTFDKKMSGYAIQNALTNGDFSFATSISGANPFLVEIINNTVTFTTSDTLVPEDTITATYNGITAESLDYGLLQPFENFPVTNNVTE